MGARDRLKHAKSYEEIQQNTPIITTPMKPKVSLPNSEPRTHQQQETIMDESIPVNVRRVMRPDVSVDRYGINPFTSTLNLYNRDLIGWVSNFSRENKMNGGRPLNKSTMIEAILDFAMYDMELEPMGFQDANELREYLRSKLK